jgi:hypothetical protein
MYERSIVTTLTWWGRKVLAIPQACHRPHWPQPFHILHCCSHMPILTHSSPGFLLHCLKQKSLFTAHIKWRWPISIAGWCHTPRWDEYKKFVYFPFHFFLCLHTPNCLIYKWHHCPVGHMVELLVEALCYKLEGHGFGSWWCQWDFSLT